MKRDALIHVVDDDESFRRAITRLLRAHDYEVAAYSSAEKFLAENANGRGCILLDVRMPGLSGLQAQEFISGRHDGLPIVFVTGHGDISMCVRAIKAGAEDFLMKPIPAERLLTAIESALAKYDDALEQHNELNALRERYQQLSPRETQVFDGVVAGKLNKEIALELGTAERTIKAHRHQVMEKMQAPSLADLVRMARRLTDGK